MNVTDAINFEDLRRMAKRHLPRIAFDYIEGGVDDEEGLDHNQDAFSRQRLIPRYLNDVAERPQATRLLPIFLSTLILCTKYQLYPGARQEDTL